MTDTFDINCFKSQGCDILRASITADALAQRLADAPSVETFTFSRGECASPDMGPGIAVDRHDKGRRNR